MCKHIHAVVLVYLLVGAPLDERQLVEREQEGVDQISESDGNLSDVGRDVEARDMWHLLAVNIKNMIDLYSSNHDVPEAVVSAGLRFLEVLRREVPVQQPEPEVEMEIETDPDVPEMDVPRVTFFLPSVSSILTPSILTPSKTLSKTPSTR